LYNEKHCIVEVKSLEIDIVTDQVNPERSTVMERNPLLSSIPIATNEISTAAQPPIIIPVATTSSDYVKTPNTVVNIDNYEFDVFLSHDWGIDELGRNNHHRVKRINEKLKAKGINTWFDEDRLQIGSNIRNEMTAAIAKSRVILFHITENYRNKVDSENSLDNCYFEFNVATATRRSKDFIVLVLEDRMKNIGAWASTSRVKAEIGTLLYLPVTEDGQIFDDRVEILAKEILVRCGK
jgi:hypothetical protein